MKMLNEEKVNIEIDELDELIDITDEDLERLLILDKKDEDLIVQDNLEKLFCDVATTIIEEAIYKYNDQFYDRKDELDELKNDLKVGNIDREQYEDDYYSIISNYQCAQYECNNEPKNIREHISNMLNLTDWEYITEEYIYEEDAKEEFNESLNSNVETTYPKNKYKKEILELGESYLDAILKMNIKIFNDKCNKYDYIFE